MRPPLRLLSTRERAIRALAQLAPWRADDRDAWLKVGMALKSLSPDLLDLWDEWSQQSPKYKPGECARQWHSFQDKAGEITFASMQYWAKQDEGDMEKRSAASPQPAIRVQSPPAKPSRLFGTPEEAAEHFARERKGAVAGIWTYCDAAGGAVMAVVRVDIGDRKEYRPLRRRGPGWVVGDPAGRLVLYELPHLLRRAQDVVYVVEGEKCADYLYDLGLLATTSSHGAGSAARTDWSPLAGRDVVILPDNDDAGERYADKVFDLLGALSPRPRVRVVRLDGLPEKGDVADFVRERWDAGVDDADVRVELETIVARSEADGLRLTRASDVRSKRVGWLWPGRIPANKVSLAVGNPDVGKSTMLLEIAARYSRGLPMPGETTAMATPGSVAICSAEDDISDTLQPRLVAAGADLGRIFFVDPDIAVRAPDGSVEQRPFTVADIDRLDQALAAHPDVRLVIVDPLSAFMGSADTHRDADVRRTLAGLRRLAERREVAVLAVMHLNKASDREAKYRVTGSLAFVGFARSALLVGIHPQDRDKPLAEARRVVARLKNNLSAEDESITFKIAAVQVQLDDQTTSLQPKVIWGENCRIRAGELLAADDTTEPKKRDRARSWLQNELASGPQTVPDLKAAAKQAEISWPTLERAAETLNVVKKPSGKGKTWLWELRGASGVGQSPTTGDVADSCASQATTLAQQGTSKTPRVDQPSDALEGETRRELAQAAPSRPASAAQLPRPLSFRRRPIPRVDQTRSQSSVADSCDGESSAGGGA